MPAYEYSAIDARGKNTTGTIDADSLRAARQRLRAQGIFPTDIKESKALAEAKSQDVSRYFQSNRVGLKDLSIATRQLGTLVGAGLPLVGAFQALAEQTKNPVLRRILVDIREDVEQGSALAQALQKFPKSFPRLYINMVAAGEASGTLDMALNNLADYLESQQELRRRIGSALMYPALMFVVCFVVIVVMFIFVIPPIVEIFRKQGAVLPLPTQIMIGLSNFLIGYWYLLLLFAIIGTMGLRAYYRQKQGRERIDHLMLKVPLVGSLYTKITTARVARTLSTLLSSGVDLLTGLDITRNIVANVHFVAALERARDGVREGKSLAKELAAGKVFPTLLSHMIAIGEKSGELENMLDKSASAFENEVNATLSGLTSLLEPVMMIVVGIIVLCIIVSVLLPMVDLISVMQR